MTRDEAVAAIKPLLPTNPAPDHTHISVPYGALKKVLADLDEAIIVGDLLYWSMVTGDDYYYYQNDEAMERWRALEVKR